MYKITKKKHINKLKISTEANAQIITVHKTIEHISLKQRIHRGSRKKNRIISLFI